MKISEAFDLYKNNYMFIKRMCRRAIETQDSVKKSLIRCLGNIEVANLDMDKVKKWVDSISFYETRDGRMTKRSINTIRNDLFRLKMVLKYLKLFDVDCLNPDLIPMPKREDVIMPFLSPDEVNRMIECASSLRNKFVISLLYSSGIRLAEMISLNRDSINNRRFSVVGKGKKMRLCFIDYRTEELLIEYLNARKDSSPALIVSNRYKDRMTPTNVQLLIKNSAKRAGINKKVTPHTLRHSFATNFLANNGNIRYLATILGHSSVNTTMIYAHIVDNELEKQYELFHSY